MPLIPILANMEMAGISLDVDFLVHMSQELETRLRELEAQVHQAVGMPFNLNSTQQLSVAIVRDTQAATASGDPRNKVSKHYSTSAEVLEYLRGKHPVSRLAARIPRVIQASLDLCRVLACPNQSQN